MNFQAGLGSTASSRFLFLELVDDKSVLVVEELLYVEGISCVMVQVLE